MGSNGEGDAGEDDICGATRSVRGTPISVPHLVAHCEASWWESKHSQLGHLRRSVAYDRKDDLVQLPTRVSFVRPEASERNERTEQETRVQPDVLARKEARGSYGAPDNGCRIED